MTGKEKIQNLTDAWYGFALFVGVANLVVNGIGVFSLVGACISTFVTFVWTYVLGRLLLGRSSITRWVLVVLSALSVIAGVVGAGKLLLDAQLGVALLTVLGVYMNARSFRVLTDRTVKAYF